MEQKELAYIKIPYPHLEDLKLKITVPICTLVILPGLGNAWVTGRYNDPKDVEELNIKENKEVTEISAIGAFGYRTPLKDLPDMRLSFGRQVPFALSIKAGDISDHFDLGGIPLSGLDIQYGSGNQIINFSYPNPHEMKDLRIQSDGGWVQIKNLSNARTNEIHLVGESTSYHLNFGGPIKNNIYLYTGVSVSKVEISVPTGTAIRVKAGKIPVSNLSDDFAPFEKEFCNVTAREGHSPVLNIHHVTSGSLKIYYF
ncbi:MAG: hypothetical protein LWX83_02025 [Anaerolineae bacterium]|nr:hypothetical protein [Anaerolineae bacterium]